MEQMLLQLDLEHAENEELNAIFRCAHSIKGGAATFGFSDVAALTHQMESLLDKLRQRQLDPTAAMVDVLLQSSDALRSQLACHQGNGGTPADTGDLLRSIQEMAASGVAAGASTGAANAAAASPPAQAPQAIESHSDQHKADPARSQSNAGAFATPAATATAHQPRDLIIRFGPMDKPEQAQSIEQLFRDISGLGHIQPKPTEDPRCRIYAVQTLSSDQELLDLLSFNVDREHIHIEPLPPTASPCAAPPSPGEHDSAAAGYGFFEGAPGNPDDKKTLEGQGFGFFEGAPGMPASSANITQTNAPAPAPPSSAAPEHPSAPRTPAKTDARTQAPGTGASASVESATLRVSVNKVDQLINLVGELVITQAMLAQNSRDLDVSINQSLLAGLADLDRNTRDLQEAVMSIRMIPMSVVFNRFPRMLRDLAAKLGKKVELITRGEATELDKGLIEKITDPLTHLIRNSCDHGIEMPEVRRSRGKPEHGTITLSASHQGGSILIEVRDDGRGLSREKLLNKARERGIDAPDSLGDSEVWNLIFAPGFSTADQVTDVSGRGVGMDVVKKNITSLGGTVEIDSIADLGMSVKVRLPLTLAIMDGMSVRVAEEIYIIPLSSVVESFQINPEMIKTVGGSAQVVMVRDEHMPVIDLEDLFNVPRYEHNATSPIMVVIEAEGTRVALMVDELLGQQQVVIKNLETNYRKVSNVSGATIMGDGKVALILDSSSLVRRAR